MTSPDNTDVPAATGRQVTLAFAGALFASVIFGGNFVAGRQAALAGLSPGDLVALRYGVSGLIFLPFLLRFGLHNLGGAGWTRGLLIAAMIGGPYFYTVMTGLHYTPASHGVVLNPGATPIASLVFGYLLLRLRPPRMVYVAVPLMLAGLTLVAGAGFAAEGPGAWRGDVLLLGTGLAYGLFMVLMRRWGIPALQATSIVAVLSGAGWLPVYLLRGDYSRLIHAGWPEVLGQALFQGLLVSGLAVFLYARAVVILGPGRAGLFPALVPVFGTVLATLVLGEPLSGEQLGGVFAVCTGLLLGVWQPRGRLWRRRQPAPPNGSSQNGTSP